MKSRDEIEALIDRVLMTLLHVEADTVAGCQRDNTPKWTSLMHIEIFFALEEEFGVRFDEDAMAFAESRGDLVDVVLEALL